MVEVNLRDTYACGGGPHCYAADVYREGGCKDYAPVQQRQKDSMSNNAREDMTRNLTPLEAGQLNGIHWRRRYSPLCEEAYVAGWHVAAPPLTMATFHDHTRTIPNMGDSISSTSFQTQNVASLGIRQRFLSVILQALQVPIPLPGEIIVLNNSWDDLDILYEADDTFVRCGWYTTA